METTSSSRAMTPGASRAVKAALAGTLIEWYDYALYGAAAGLVIGPLFFPGFLSEGAAMAAFATFAVGFIVRPLGGVIVSHIGDRFGRKPAMILTIVLMGIATVAIGLLPTAAQIGIWAPVLLVLFRLLQGFGAGAELAGAVTLVSEYTPRSRRGFFMGLISSGAPGGVLLATLAYLVASTAPQEAFMTWVWRIPFLFSVVLFFLAMYIRNSLNETPEYSRAMEKSAQAKQAHKVPLGQLISKSPRQLLGGFMSITGHNATNYVLSAFALSYLTITIGMPRTQALVVVIVSSVFGVVGPLVGGLFVDRFGARKMVVFGGISGMVLAYPLFAALQTGNMWIAMLGMCAGQFLVLGATSPGTSTFLVNLFPTRYRFTGVSMSRELNGALIAGPTPLIATALIVAAGGQIWLVGLFLVTCCLVTAVSVLVVGRELGNSMPEEVPAETAPTSARNDTLKLSSEGRLAPRSRPVL